jgi:oxysterol 7-alpha-hydroxylase
MTTTLLGRNARLPEPASLTAWDQLIGPFYARFVLFYRASLDQERVHASLERLVSVHPLLAGRLRSERGGRWAIHARGQGAGFEVVRSSLRWPWAEGQRGSRIDLRPYEAKLPLRVLNRDAPLFSVRLTQLTGGGSALAVAFSHVLGDVATFDRFFRDWERGSAGQEVTERSSDRLALELVGSPEARSTREHPALVPVSRLRELGAQARIVATLPWLSTRAWHLPAAEIRALHTEVSGQSGSSPGPSASLALAAQLWRVLALTHSPARNVSFSIVADVRRRVPSLPAHLLGNACVSPVANVAEPDASVTARVRALTAVLGELDAEAAGREMAAARHLLIRQRPLPFVPRAIRELYEGGLMFESWRELGIYGLDLGAGRPHWFQSRDAPLPGLIVARPTPEADGSVDLDVTLPRGQWSVLDRVLPGPLSEQGVAALRYGRTHEHAAARRDLVTTHVFPAPTLRERLRAAWGGAAHASEPPLVTGNVPLLGAAGTFGRDALAFLQRCQREHGDAFTVYMAGARTTFLADPRDYPRLLKQHTDFEFHTLGERFSERGFGYSSQASAAISYDYVSSYTADTLKAADLDALTERARERLQQLVRHIPPRTDDLYDLVHRWAFDVGTHCVFGDGYADEARRQAFATVDRFFPLRVAGLPTAALPGCGAADAQLRQANLCPYSGRSRLLEGREAYFARCMSDADRGGMETALLWAALANTVPAMFWTLWHLGADRMAQTRVRAELETVLGGRSLSCLDRRTLADLKLLDSCITEALRLSSGVMVVREVTHNARFELVSGKHIALRRGDRIALYPSLTMRDSAVFERPDEFVADRFLDNPQFYRHGERIINPVLVFGGGVSMCPGRHFARNEIKLLTAMLLADAELALSLPTHPGYQLERSGFGILPPRTRVTAAFERIEARHPRSAARAR